MRTQESLFPPASRGRGAVEMNLPEILIVDGMGVARSVKTR